MHRDALRTTLTIDAALLRRLRQKALDTGRPFKQVVNGTLRAGLNQAAPRRSVPYRCPSFSIGALAPGVDLTSDAHLAALAIEHNGTLCSADSDFRRFPGLRFRNPLA